MTTAISPPSTLSGLLELALSDAEKSVSEGFKLDMSRWLKYPECSACLAGCVLLQTLRVVNADAHGVVTPFDAPEEWQLHLIGLNYIRIGRLSIAWEYITSQSPPESLVVLSRKWSRKMLEPRLHGNDAFFSCLREMLSDLKKAGL